MHIVYIKLGWVPRPQNQKNRLLRKGIERFKKMSYHARPTFFVLLLLLDPTPLTSTLFACDRGAGQLFV